MVHKTQENMYLDAKLHACQDVKLRAFQFFVENSNAKKTGQKHARVCFHKDESAALVPTKESVLPRPRHVEKEISSIVLIPALCSPFIVEFVGQSNLNIGCLYV